MSGAGEIGVGIIGAGKRGISCLGSRMAESATETGLRVVALCDRNTTRLEEACALLLERFAAQGVTVDIALHTDHAALIDSAAVDLVLITTPSHAHREPAVAALNSPKKVYLDKPIAHDLADSLRIAAVEAKTGNHMLMGFTRRYEEPWRKAYALLQEGVIGDLHMMQMRAVVPYHVYFHTWHRRREWSGGALNDKSSHHFDVFNWFAGSRAVRLSGMGGGPRVYVPNPDAPGRCLDCDADCPYRIRAPRAAASASDAAPADQDRMVEFGNSWDRETEEMYRHDTCVFRPGADIKDHAIVQVAYENGVVASLFWSIFGPRAKDQETFELVGTKGRIILTRHTGELDVVTDYGKRQETIDCREGQFGSSHFGADFELIREMRAFYDGRIPLVSGQDGLAATRMVMAAHDSIDAGGTLVDLAAD